MAIPGESSTMSSLGPELDTSFCFLLRRRYHQNSINKISTATPPTIPPMIGPTGLWLDFSSLVEEFGMLLAELVEGEEFVVAGTKEVVVVLESVTIGFVTLTQLASEDADTETMSEHPRKCQEEKHRRMWAYWYKCQCCYCLGAETIAPFQLGS